MAVSGNLQQVGVEAVVEGLQSFISDIGRINSTIESLRPPATELQNLFDAAMSSVSNFGREVLNVVETALGVMLRDALEWTIEKLGELAAAAFEAGNEFQLMKMRLQGFNLQDAIDSGMAYDEAMQKAVEVTKEQLDWIMKLAATTPFDATDIANIYTLSKSYGFSNDAASTMTQSILDFTAAMGLSGVEAERLIINLGQMAQRGKITTREMNDLARGAFVPIRDILDRISEKMGITTKKLTELIQKPGGGVDYQLFIDAFNEMVAQEERFQGGAVRMAHTFRGAWENIIQTIRDVVGGFIVLPGLLDPLGQALGDIMDAVGEHWDEISTAAQGVGDSIGEIVSKLLSEFMPSGETIADGIVSGLDSIKGWIDTNKPYIFNFIDQLKSILSGQGFTSVATTRIGMPKQPTGFTNFLDGILKAIDTIKSFIDDKLIPAFDAIKEWINTNKPLIDDFFKTVGEVLSGIFQNVTKEYFGKPVKGGLTGFLEGLKDVMKWVIQNKDFLIDFISRLTIAFINYEIVMTSINLLLGGFLEIIQFLISPWRLLQLVVLDFVGATVLLKDPLQEVSNKLRDLYGWIDTITKDLGKDIGIKFAPLRESIINAFNDIKKALSSVDWKGIGTSIIMGLINGIVGATSQLISIVVNAVLRAYNAAKAALGIKSPSILFNKLGQQSIAGFGQGFTDKTVTKNVAGEAVSTRDVAVSNTVSSIMNSINNRYFNLTVNTRSSHESIIQDYRMLSAMAQ